MTDEAPKNSPVAPDIVGWWQALLNPVVIIALLMLGAVITLISFATMGWDRGVLVSMGRIDYARGLITYLYAVVTIGTAVILLVSALTGSDSEVHERRFQRGKEILALLLGIFGTMVGFYFGSEIGQKTGLQTQDVTIAPFHMSSQSLNSGEQLTIQTYVSGGTAPYKYGIAVDDEVPVIKLSTADGWIENSLAVPVVTARQPVRIHLVAVDSAGHKTDAFGSVDVNPGK